MNIHYLQHVPYEDLGTLEKWVYRTGNRVSATKFFEDDKMPFVDAFDLLIILGGPMSVGDEEQYPWLSKEKELISKAIAKNKLILGICLGAQLVADVMGAKVFPNLHKEIGWFPITVKHNHELSKHLPSKPVVFHWHGDTFTLPSSAQLIASTDVCTNQAYMVGNAILALQFHLETNEKLIKQFLDNGEAELEQKGEFIQDRISIENNIEKYCNSNEQLLFTLLDQWVALNQ